MTYRQGVLAILRPVQQPNPVLTLHNRRHRIAQEFRLSCKERVEGKSKGKAEPGGSSLDRP
jgi:hypothetical protein